MLTNYFKIAWRTLLKNKGTSLIHIFGLTVGLTGCLLIGLFVFDELKFDMHHPETDLKFRIFTKRVDDSGGAYLASTSPVFGPSLQADFPEVDQTLRIFRIREKQLFKNAEQVSLEEKGLFVEANIFNFFDLPFLHGNPNTALSETNSIVLTEPLAKKYFGDVNPVGKTVLVNNSERKITGVLKPLSKHFHLDFNFLVSFETLLSRVSSERINSWVWQDFFNYVQVKPDTDVVQLQKKLTAYVETNAHPQTKEMGFYYVPYLQRLKDVYLHSSSFRNDMAIRGNSQYLTGFIIVGCFLLFIACINFINLTTAKAVRRAKEVGVRKASGALRSQLAVQFISEAVLTIAISMLFGIILTTYFLPYLNDFSGKELSFSFFQQPALIPLLLGVILFIGVLAGFYPALVLSGFKPVDALKGNKARTASRVEWLRKGLVTIQFAISTLMIISVIIIFQQVNFFSKKELGFNKEQLIHFPMKKSLFQNFEHTKAEFLKVPGVTSASTCFGIPGDIVSGDNVITPGAEPKTLPARIFAVDHEYIKTMGMELIAGRDFSKEVSTDATESFIINEAALKNLNLAESPEEVIGKPLNWEGWDDARTMKKGKVIGVVKDFNYNSLHEEVETGILHIYPDAYWKLALRLDSKDLSQTIFNIEKTWDDFNTGYPLDYQFVDEDLNSMYQAEQKLSSLFWIFALLAITISCIGALGLAAYAAEQRRKEIGIRKILGANVVTIVKLLSVDFLKLVLIALIIASPLAWYFLNNWLDNFAYRIDVEWWVFLLTAFITIVAAIIPLGFQSLKAAFINPSDSLRSE